MKKAIKSALFAVLCAAILLMPVLGISADQIDDYIYARVADYAGLLTSSEIQSLQSDISHIVKQYEADVVIFTTDSVGDEDPEEYLESVYNTYGYGIGDDRSGVMLLVSTETRDYAINSFGSVGEDGEAFNDAALYVMEEDFLPYLMENDFYGAFNAFVSDADYILECAAQGEYYCFIDEYEGDDDFYDFDDYSDSYYPSGSRANKGVRISWTIIIPFAIALLIGWLVASNLKKSMHTAKMQAGASYYLKEGSFDLTGRSDVYLYSNIVKTRRNDDSGSKSGGGGSVSMGSSGSSHSGGRSGKF